MSKTKIDQFKTLRRTSGFSQQELTRFLGFDNSMFISQIERRERLVTAEALCAYHILFGVPIEEIVPKLYDEIRRTIISNVAAFQDSETQVRKAPRHFVRDESLQEFRLRQRKNIRYESKH